MRLKVILKYKIKRFTANFLNALKNLGNVNCIKKTINTI